MTVGQDPWRLLGIAPGSDARTIKMAYAGLLKTIDADADPAAFIALRAAMEQAIDELRWRDRADWQADDAEAFDEAAVAIPVGQLEPASSSSLPSSPLEAVAVESPVADEPGPDPIAALNDELRTLSGLLFTEQDAGKIGWQIELCWREILANPALERIDVLADVERWFAGAIAESLPRSDPLIWPAIKQFGWSGDDQRWNGDGRVAAILRRQRDLYFLHQLSEPGNLLHYAFNLLHQWPDEVLPKDRSSKENGVRILLRSIRYLFPTAEWNFDAGKVQAWINHLEAPPTGLMSKLGSGDGHPVFDGGAVFDGTSVITAGAAPDSDGWVDESTPAIVWIGMVVMPIVACWWTLRKGYSFWGRLLAFGWAAIFVIAMIPEQSTTGSSEMAADPASLESRITDRLDRLQRENPDLAAVRTGNPALFARIRAAVHEREMNHVDEPTMVERINETIDEAFADALPGAGQAALVRHFRLRQTRLFHLLQEDARLCADETRPFNTGILPSSYRQDMKQHVIRTIIEPQGMPVAKTRIGMAAIFREAAKSLAISQDQLALRLSTPSQARPACEAKLALLKVIGSRSDAEIAAFVREGLQRRPETKAS